MFMGYQKEEKMMLNFLLWEILLPITIILTPLGIAALIEHYKEARR